MKIVNAEKKLLDKLIDECTETIEEVKLVNITFTDFCLSQLVFG